MLQVRVSDGVGRCWCSGPFVNGSWAKVLNCAASFSATKKMVKAQLRGVTSILRQYVLLPRHDQFHVRLGLGVAVAALAVGRCRFWNTTVSSTKVKPQTLQIA